MENLKLPSIVIRSDCYKGRYLMANQIISIGVDILFEQPLLASKTSSSDFVSPISDLVSEVVISVATQSISKEEIESFCTNPNNPTQSDRYISKYSFAKAISHLQKKRIRYDGITEEYCLYVLRRLQVNIFEIVNDLNCTIGLGLYKTGSLFNHSCNPNSCQIFENNNLYIRAIRTIKPGDEVTISYVDVGRPAWWRRMLLLKSYGFLCLCPRCMEEQSLSSVLTFTHSSLNNDDFYSLVYGDSTLCPQNNCNGSCHLTATAETATTPPWLAESDMYYLWLTGNIQPFSIRTQNLCNEIKLCSTFPVLHFFPLPLGPLIAKLSRFQTGSFEGDMVTSSYELKCNRCRTTLSVQRIICNYNKISIFFEDNLQINSKRNDPAELKKILLLLQQYISSKHIAIIECKRLLCAATMTKIVIAQQSVDSKMVGHIMQVSMESRYNVNQLLTLLIEYIEIADTYLPRMAFIYGKSYLENDHCSLIDFDPGKSANTERSRCVAGSKEHRVLHIAYVTMVLEYADCLISLINILTTDLVNFVDFQKLNFDFENLKSKSVQLRNATLPILRDIICSLMITHGISHSLTTHVKHKLSNFS